MLKLKNIFSDNALFQAGSSLGVKGSSHPFSSVVCKILLGDEVISSSESSADGEGHFTVTVKTPESSFREYSITVSETSRDGKTDCVTIKNILFGELWISAGQSNMEMQNHYMDDNQEVYDALAERKIRIYLQDWLGRFTLTPEEFAVKSPVGKANLTNWMNEFAVDPDVSYDEEYDIGGKWLVCGKDEILMTERASALATSAVLEAYNRLNSSGCKNIPFGFLNVSVGGTSGQAWISKKIIAQSPELLESFEINGFYTDRERWFTQDSATYNRPFALYNLKIVPIEGVKAAGVMWYQGENNVCNLDSRRLYREIMKAFFVSYKETFGADENFTMITAQIYPFLYDEEKCGIFNINAAMADVAAMYPGHFITLTDCDFKTVYAEGRNHPIHPAHKYELGKRFANAVLRCRHGEPGIKNPAAAVSYKFEGSCAFVSFGCGGYPLDLRSSDGFRISSDGKVYYDAEAELISEDTVKLSHPAVSSPRECSYDCGDMDIFPSLYCGDLPVLPFSSDMNISCIQTRPWLDTAVESFSAVSYYECGLDFFARPTWRPEGNCELCRDGNFTKGAKAIRIRGENGSCGAFVSSYPSERLDFENFSCLTFELTYPCPVKCSAELLCADKKGTEYVLSQNVSVHSRVSFNRDIIKVSFSLPEDADIYTCRRLTLHFENVSDLPKVCSVTIGGFTLL